MRAARLRSWAAAAAVGGAAVVVGAACNDDAFVQPCTGIPAGGCPLSHGVACADPACESVYACLENDNWQLDHVCPPHPDAGVVVVDVDAGDADVAPSPGLDASIDAPPGAFGGPGCVLLQSPDCTLGFALACPQGCCDCEDLFVCQDGTWNAWGVCADGGIRTP